MTEKECLWLTEDGRCACCKARRIRLDILNLDNYKNCHPGTDYAACEFFKELPPRKR